MSLKFYERAYQSNYEELLTYYPGFYREVYEIREILKAHGKLLDGLEKCVERAYLNNFIRTADEETIVIWEKMLGITYKETMTLDQRRSVIIGRISGYGHIGVSEIRGIVANYTDSETKIDFSNGVITLKIDGEIFGEDNLHDTLLRRIPAHIPLNIEFSVIRKFRQRFKVSFGSTAGVQLISSKVDAGCTSIRE